MFVSIGSLFINPDRIAAIQSHDKNPENNTLIRFSGQSGDFLIVNVPIDEVLKKLDTAGFDIDR